MPNKQTIEISTGIVFRTILILLVIWFLYAIRDIVALLFISIIIVSAIDPVVDFLQKKKISRSVGVLLIYFVIFSLLGLAFSFLFPPLAEQLRDFSKNLPLYAGGVENFVQGIGSFFQAKHIAIDGQKIIDDLTAGFASVSQGIFSTTLGIFSGFVGAALVLVMTFYMSVKEEGIKNFIVSITPEKHKEYAASLTDRIKGKIGRWMLGQLFLMFTIFLMYLVGLTLFGLPYALSLAIFAGIMEIIPYVGPFTGAVPAIIVAFLVSPLTGFFVLLMLIGIQQFESHIIIPQVMRKAVGLHPIAVILALLIGAKLGGILGAILAIPVATAISVFVSDLFQKSQEA
jgi:predicted PurR-regulated permease PerM